MRRNSDSHPDTSHSHYPHTPQVLGNAKGVVAVVLSLLYFRNPVNFYSVFGYAVTVTGVVMYSQVSPWGLAGEPGGAAGGVSEQACSSSA